MDKKINNKLYDRFVKRVNDNANERFRPTSLLLDPQELMLFSSSSNFDENIKR